MVDTPRRRYSRSPSPKRRYVRSRSRSRSASQSRSPYRSRSPVRRDISSRDDVSNPGNNLYVTGLSARVVEADLEELFNQEGKVVDCRIVVDPRSRESRGFGFVTMDTSDNADRCVKYLNRSTLEGRIITVEKLSTQSAVSSCQCRNYGANAFYFEYNLTNDCCKRVGIYYDINTQNISANFIWRSNILFCLLQIYSSSTNLAKRKRARTPTPGSYLGVRATVRPRSYGRHRDSHSSRRSPQYSPYRGSRERDYDRDRSPYHSGPSYRRERSRSPEYSPYRR